MMKKNAEQKTTAKDTAYRWLNANSKKFLEESDGYLLAGQTVPERVDIICNEAERILNKPGYAERLKHVVEQGWCSLSTPIWSNFGTGKGLGISCFSSYVDDTMASILETQAEVGMMTKLGGGTSAYFGNVRGRGAPVTNNGHSAGSVHFMQLFNTIVGVVSQGSRRGSFAAYLPIDHPDIEEFLRIKSEGFYIQDISFGVCVPEGWMQSMIDGDAKKRKLWAKILETRANVGYPYILFLDNVNDGTVDVYKDKEMRITNSNLCVEVALPTCPDESFVCDLASMNILHYDEWKDTDAVEVVVYLLDAVMTDFIEKASKIPFMHRAVKFAERHRALGLGWLGWHSFLQSKMIPWESMSAKYLNVEVAKYIQSKAWEASRKMAEEYGEPELLKGYGRRHTTLTAIAPTKSCVTPKTKFKDENSNDVDYFEFAKRGGIDLEEVMSIEVEFEDGKSIKYKHDEKIIVTRNGCIVSVAARDLKESDIL